MGSPWGKGDFCLGGGGGGGNPRFPTPLYETLTMMSKFSIKRIWRVLIAFSTKTTHENYEHIAVSRYPGMGFHLE